MPKINFIIIDTFFPLILFWFLFIITFTNDIRWGILAAIIYALDAAYISGRLQKVIIEKPPDLKINLITPENFFKDLILMYMIVFWPITSLVILVKYLKRVSNA